jgi:hypothetical protein
VSPSRCFGLSFSAYSLISGFRRYGSCRCELTGIANRRRSSESVFYQTRPESSLEFRVRVQGRGGVLYQTRVTHSWSRREYNRITHTHVLGRVARLMPLLPTFPSSRRHLLTRIPVSFRDIPYHGGSRRDRGGKVSISKFRDPVLLTCLPQPGWWKQRSRA